MIIAKKETYTQRRKHNNFKRVFLIYLTDYILYSSNSYNTYTLHLILYIYIIIFSLAVGFHIIRLKNIYVLYFAEGKARLII